MNERDGHLLRRAFREAERATWLFTAPNPRVGALALSGGHILGRGHHARFGSSHAEEAALKDAGAWNLLEDVVQAGVVDEVVVSLEPCSSSGGEKRRRACTDTLIQAGVRRVVIGALDPDPRHQGAGVERLRAAGIEVVVAEGLDESFAAANAAFLRGLEHGERPWILLKWAASLDGKTASDRGASFWITGSEARSEVHALRACSDAVMAGKGTLLQDDPRLDVRLEPSHESPELRTTPTPLRVLFPPPEGLSGKERVFACGGPRLWVVSIGAPLDPVLQTRVDDKQDKLLAVPPDAAGRADLEASMHALRREHGVRRILIEGGPTLHGALLDAGLADAIVRYEAPILMGGHHGAAMSSGSPAPAQAARLTQEEACCLGADQRRAFLIQTTWEAEASVDRVAQDG